MNADKTPVDGIKTSGANTTYWLESSSQSCGNKTLKENLQTDVVIVGGGLAGLSVAYALTEAGKKVVVIEDGLIGSGETGRTTAHLVTALDDRYTTLQKIYGEEDTRLIADSHKAAILFVEHTVIKENIDCQFVRVPGYLFLHPSDDSKTLREEFDAATKAGLEVGMLDKIPGMPASGPCIEFANQAQFHPLLYLGGLCRVIEKKGGKIFTQTHADKINHEGITTSDGFTVKADHVVVATNTPVNNMVAMHLKQTAFRTYVIAGLIKKYSVPRALWWDTGDQNTDKDYPPYHYVRTQPYNEEYDLLISGGEDHPTGDVHKEKIQEEDRNTKLEAWTREHFPIEKILYRWSGQVMEPVDSLGFIGRNPMDKDNVYIVTGDSGTGMTHCTIAGVLITDLILGRKNPWEHIYKPSRISVQTGDVFFKELMRGIMSVFRGAPQDDRVKELSEIQPGDGKVCNIDGHKCGVYRDQSGEYHIISARCSHLRATLTWNATEKTWDCPWHGSRFTRDGLVINGPAINDLPQFDESGVFMEESSENISK